MSSTHSASSSRSKVLSAADFVRRRGRSDYSDERPTASDAGDPLGRFRSAVRRFTEATGGQDIKCDKAPPAGPPDNVVWPQQAAPQEWKTKLIEGTLPNKKSVLNSALQHLQSAQPNTVGWACTRDKVKVAAEHLKFSSIRLQTLLKFAELNTLANPKQAKAHDTVKWGLQMLPGIVGEVNQLLSKAEQAAGVKLKHIGVRTSNKEEIKYGHAKAGQVLEAIKSIYKDDPEALKKELDFFQNAQALGNAAPEPQHDTPQAGITPAGAQPDQPAHQTEPLHPHPTPEPAPQPAPPPAQPQADAPTPQPQAAPAATSEPAPTPTPTPTPAPTQAQAPQPPTSQQPDPQPAPQAAEPHPAQPAPTPLPSPDSPAPPSPTAAPVPPQPEVQAQAPSTPLPAPQAPKPAIAAPAVASVPQPVPQSAAQPPTGVAAPAGQQFPFLAHAKKHTTFDDEALKDQLGLTPGAQIDAIRDLVIKYVQTHGEVNHSDTGWIVKGISLALKANPAVIDGVVADTLHAIERAGFDISPSDMDAITQSVMGAGPGADIDTIRTHVLRDIGIWPTTQLAMAAQKAALTLAKQGASSVMPAGLMAIAPSPPKSVLPASVPQKPAPIYQPPPPPPPPPPMSPTQAAYFKGWAKQMIQPSGAPPADLMAQLVKKAAAIPEFGTYDPNHLSKVLHEAKSELTKDAKTLSPEQVQAVTNVAKQELKTPEALQSSAAGFQMKLMKTLGFWVQKEQGVAIFSKVKELGPDPVSMDELPPPLHAMIGNHAKSTAINDAYEYTGDLDSAAFKQTLKAKIEQLTTSQGIKLHAQDYDDIAKQAIENYVNKGLGDLSPDQHALVSQVAQQTAKSIGHKVTALDLKKALQGSGFLHMNSSALTGALEAATQVVFKPNEPGLLAEITSILAGAPKTAAVPTSWYALHAYVNELAKTQGTPTYGDLLAKYHISLPGALNLQISQIGMAEAKKRFSASGANAVLFAVFDELWAQGEKINVATYVAHALTKHAELAAVGFFSANVYSVAGQSGQSFVTAAFYDWFKGKDENPSAHPLPDAFKGKALKSLLNSPNQQFSHIISNETGLSKGTGLHHVHHGTWPTTMDKAPLDSALAKAVKLAGFDVPADGVLKGFAVHYGVPIANVKKKAQQLAASLPSAPAGPVPLYGGTNYAQPSPSSATAVAPLAASIYKDAEHILGLSAAALEKFATTGKPENAPVPPPKSALHKLGMDEEGHHQKFKAKSVDENGFMWMYKIDPDKRVISLAETAANRVQVLLGLPAPEFVWQESFGGHTGSWHYYKPAADFGRKSLEEWANPSILNSVDTIHIKDLQRAGISNWINANHDGHGENLVVMTDPSGKYADHKGHLMPIDLGQSGKYLFQHGQPYDKLDVEFDMNNVEHHMMLRGWASGVDIPLAPINDPQILDMFDRAEAIPSEVFRTLWKPYAETAQVKGVGGVTSAMILDRLDSRRKTARADFAALYRGLVERRLKNEVSGGKIKQSQIDARRQQLLDALGIPQFETYIASKQLGPIAEGKAPAPKPETDLIQALPEADRAVRHSSGVPKMEALRRLGTVGLDMMVGGTDVRDSRASFWTLGDMPFVEMTLNPEACQRLEKKLPKHGGSLGPAAAHDSNSSDYKVQQLNSKIMGSGLTKHLDIWASGNPAGITSKSAGSSVYAKLKYFHAAYLAAKTMAASADALTKAAGEHYVKQFAKIGTGEPNADLAGGSHVPLPPDGYVLDNTLPVGDRKIEPFEAPPPEVVAVPAAPQNPGTLAKCGPNVPPPCADHLNYTAYPAALAASLKGEPSQQASLLNGHFSTQHTSGLDGNAGESYRIKLGDGVVVNYVPRTKKNGGELQSLHARKGQLRIEFEPGVSVTDEMLHGALDKLKALGLTVKHASKEDAELEYLRQMAWLRKLQGVDTSGTIKFPAGSSKAEKIDLYLKAFTKELGYDPRYLPIKSGGKVTGSTNQANPYYQPVPTDVGARYSYRRFDMTDAEIQQKVADGFRLYSDAGYHDASKGNHALYSMLLNGQAVSYERRLTRGLPFCGASNAADTTTGGSKEVFLRIGNAKKGHNFSANSSALWELDLGLLAHTHAYSMPGDSFGNKKGKAKGSYYDHYMSPSKRASTLDENVLTEAMANYSTSNNETLVADVIDLDRWVRKVQIHGKGVFGDVNHNDHVVGGQMKNTAVQLEYRELLDTILERLKSQGKKTYGGIQVFDDSWNPLMMPAPVHTKGKGKSKKDPTGEQIPLIGQVITQKAGY